MSTRGIIGFRLNNKDKLTHNHCDSSPETLGKHTINSLCKFLKEPVGFKEKIKALKPVNSSVLPTKKQADRLIDMGYANLHVGSQSSEDWYCLLRNTQGDISAILDAGLFEKSESILSSLFCEYGYIINMDTEVLEFYLDFQKSSHSLGRYGKTANTTMNEYYPCALAAKYPFLDVMKHPRKTLNNMIKLSGNSE